MTDDGFRVWVEDLPLTDASRKVGTLETDLPHPAASPAATAPLLILPAHPLRGRALAWLLFATVLWGLSFPLAKVLVMVQQKHLPGADTLFLVAWAVVFRFGVAGIVMTLAALGTLRELTRGELLQGIGLGFFAAGGILLQNDGINYTAASTSAFLTSCYCVIIPLVVAIQRKRLPPWPVVGCCLVVLAGMGVLAGVDWRSLHLGRGEWETLACSVFYAGQILWLEQPRFARNRPAHASVIMFGVLALTALPLALGRTAGPGELAAAFFGTRSILLLLVAMTIFCTLATFTLMNYWQKYVEATEAGLIYCIEPVWTSLLTLFLPGWLSLWTGVAYANEVPTWKMLVGGGLITLANAALQLFGTGNWELGTGNSKE